MGAPLSHSIHCPKAHFLIPSYERLVFQHRNFEGTLTFSPLQLSWKVMSRRLIGLSMCTVPDVLMPRFGQIHAYVSVAAGTEPTPISMVVSPPRQPEAPRQEQHSTCAVGPDSPIRLLALFWPLSQSSGEKGLHPSPKPSIGDLVSPTTYQPGRSTTPPDHPEELRNAAWKKKGGINTLWDKLWTMKDRSRNQR